MNTEETFSNSAYEDEIHVAERELAAFLSAVTNSYGPEQAHLAATDWLDEAEQMDSPPRSTCREWRAVTIAASARLAKRLTVIQNHVTSLGTSFATPIATSTDTKAIADASVQWFRLHIPFPSFRMER